MSFLLTTKLIPPKVPQTYVTRPRLFELLETGIESKVTLLTAPAGYGKTTLVTDWLTNGKLAAGIKTAWLSLDEFDDDPMRFIEYFVAAWQSINPDLGATTRELLNGNTAGLLQSTPHNLVIPLINDLAAFDQPTLLVLDDWHLIKNKVSQNLLTYWIENAPPQSHVVITTRHVPELLLSRWRVRGQINEIIHTDLQFTFEETQSFFREKIKIDVDDAEILQLIGKTEGWAASLQLVALTLQGHSDSKKPLAKLSGNLRYVVDYLIDEVLEKESAEIRAFLSDTSILTRLTAPLCNAVTGLDNSQALLLMLDQRNLFINSVDEARVHFRYHPLFADTLQKQIEIKQPARLKELHEKAYRFFMDNNTWNEGIKHGLAAGRFAEVAEFLKNHTDDAIWKHNQASQVVAWCKQIPLDILKQHPRLMLDFGWAQLWGGMLKSLKNYIEKIEPYFENYPSQALSIEFVALRAEVTITNKRLDDSLDTLNSINYAELTNASCYELIRQVQGYINRIDGNVAISENALKDARKVCAEKDNLILWLGASTDLADLYRVAGRLNESTQIFNEVLQHIPSDRHVIYGAIHFGMINHAGVLLRQNQLAAALECVQQGLLYARSNNREFVFERLALLAMAHIRQAQGDAKQALQLMERAHEKAVKGKNKRSIAGLQAQLARLHLLQGQPKSITQWAQDFPLTRPAHIPRLQYQEMCVIYGHWLLTQDLAAAIEYLQSCRQSAEENLWGDCLLESLILLTLAYQQNNQLDTALAHLEKAVDLAEPERIIEPFVTAGQPMTVLLRQLLQRGGDKEQIGRIQAAFLPTTVTQQDLIDPLTKRELEILKLMSDGLSNPEIADKLIIATGTVARHTNNIFGKLAVRNRTEATVQAKTLNLI